jgi:excisionase family DNA binding protein
VSALGEELVMLEQLLELMRELIGEVHLLRMEVYRRSENVASHSRPLTREEAADYLGVHKDTLYRWAIEEGRIAYSRLGEGGRSPIRFTRKDLDDFLEHQRIGTLDQTLARRTYAS